jgi:hypothetical protein
MTDILTRFCDSGGMARSVEMLPQLLVAGETPRRAQLESLYRVALHRLEPVGLVVLWPETRG